MWVMMRSGFCRKRCRMLASSIVTSRLLADELFPLRIVERIGDREDVFVAAPGLVDDDRLGLRQAPDLLERLRECVRGLERRDQTLFSGRQGQRVHHLTVGRRLETHPA